VVLQFPLVAAGAGLLLVNALFADNAATRVLAHPAWYPLARVSYGTYLVHPYVLFWCITHLRGALGLDVVGAANLAALYAIVLGLSWAIASVLFVTVERPLLDLGARLAGRRPAPVCPSSPRTR
jgi:peptidoglycan/LPS O-acetylase OafA/YrhL